jgi:outer membrane protein assembly factor BamD
MARNKRILLVLLTVVFLLGGCMSWLPWGKRTDMARATPDGLYQQGLEEYKDGNYKRSVELFQRVKEEYPLSPLAIMAEIGIADSFFSGKEYPEAGLAYSEFLSLHPTNENLPYVMYQIGMSYYNQMTTVDRDQAEAFKALKEFERLIARFPGSKFAVMAEKMVRDCKKAMGEKEFYVGEFYFKIKEYRAALRRFEKITRDYANVGLDDKVNRFIGETKRRIAEQEAKKRPAENQKP